MNLKFNAGKSTDDGCKIPDNYHLLPRSFFSFKGIPLPLVTKSWFQVLIEEHNVLSKKEATDNSDEDELTLAELKHKISKTFNNQDSLNNFDILETKSSNTIKLKPLFDKYLDASNKISINLNKEQKNIQTEKTSKKKLLINRKRGRPRKLEIQKESSKLFVGNWEDVNNDDDDDDDDDNDGIDHCIINNNSENGCLDPNNDFKKVDRKFVIKISEDVDISYKEHNYFKISEKHNSFEMNENKVNNAKVLQNEVIQNTTTKQLKVNYSCLECGKTFSAPSTLKNHKRIHDGTLLNCKECRKGFTTKYLLKCHMRIHNGDLFKCSKCDKGFITAELLKVHMRGHNGDKPFSCNVCGRSFPSTSNLLQHKQTHSLEKKYLCFQCGSSFSQKRCLDGHMLSHSEKNHICNVCGKLWARKSDLIEHMRVHTGVKPYSCRICQQKFTQASSLKRHQIVHVDVQPVQCQTCSKMFKCQDYYKKHIRKHEKETPFVLINN